MSFRQDSVFSIGGVAYRHSEEINYDEMTADELEQMIQDVQQKNWTLERENGLFERYLTRVDPQSVKRITQILARAKYAQKVATQLAPMSSRMSFRDSILSLHDKSRPSVISTPSIASVHSGSRHATPSLLTTGTLREGAKLTLTHRMRMVDNEIEEMKKSFEHKVEMTKKQKARIRLEMEELDLRTTEAYEAQIEFNTRVVKQGVDPITGKIPAEKIVRFIEDWLKTADTIIERLRLKSTAMKSQIKKARQQLVQREELGEALHAVDFEQLHIENKDYARQIEEKNRYLLEMKKITGRFSLELTKHKQKLNDLVLAESAVREEITEKEQQIGKLKSEYMFIKNEVQETKEQLDSLIELIEDYRVPDILDFVKLQAEIADLQKMYKRLCRRKKIQQIMFKAQQKDMIHTRSHKSDDSSWLLSDSKILSESTISMQV